MFYYAEFSIGRSRDLYRKVEKWRKVEKMRKVEKSGKFPQKAEKVETLFSRDILTNDQENQELNGLFY